MKYISKNRGDITHNSCRLADAPYTSPFSVLTMGSTSDIPSPDDVKIQNLNQLQISATRYADIKSFLEYTDTFQEETVNDDKEGVSLMTIHKAKGLEFPVVFVIGLVEGITPTKKGDIEEERRIVFVAISRAMKILYLSYSRSFLGQPCKKSVFLDEIMGVKRLE